MALYAAAIMAAVPSGMIKLQHYIGGPCFQSNVTALALLHYTHSQDEMKALSVSIVGQQGAPAVPLPLFFSYIVDRRTCLLPSARGRANDLLRQKKGLGRGV